jgi:hypothetical protein
VHGIHSNELGVEAINGSKYPWAGQSQVGNYLIPTVPTQAGQSVEVRHYEHLSLHGRHS